MEQQRRATDHDITTENRLTTLEVQVSTMVKSMSKVTDELHTLNKSISTFLAVEPLMREIHAGVTQIPVLQKRVEDLEEEAVKDTRPKLQTLRDDLIARTSTGKLVALVASSGILGFIVDRLVG